MAARLSNLATLLRDTNRAEAESLMRRALAIDEAVYTTEHPVVAVHLNNLAQLLPDTNRLEEGEPMLRRSVEIFLQSQRDNGHPHIQQATALKNYCVLLGELGVTEPEAKAKVVALASSYGVTLPE